MSSAMELLPNELLDQIISYLATEPPSAKQLHDPPARQITQSQTKDLKHLAQVSSRLLDLVRPQLFNHACLELQDEPAFQAFITASDLDRHVKSLVVITAEKLVDPVHVYWWRRVLRYLDPARITVLAPPTIIGNMLNSPIMDGHSWAFHIPLQVLQLERAGPFHKFSSPLPSLEDCESLLVARPWTGLAFNESSSLKAYNHYEYFLSRVPSVLGEWGSTLKSQEPPSLSPALCKLTSFSYTAIFPFYNHVALVLEVLSLMTNLRNLSVQLVPGVGNHITEEEQRGSMDLNDPWMELSTAYSLITHEVCRKPSLESFQSRDFTFEALRLELCQILDDGLGHTSWRHDGYGSWTRRVEAH